MKLTFAAPMADGSDTAGAGVPAFFHVPRRASIAFRASAIEMSPAIAITAWSGTKRVRCTVTMASRVTFVRPSSVSEILAAGCVP